MTTTAAPEGNAMTASSAARVQRMTYADAHTTTTVSASETYKGHDIQIATYVIAPHTATDIKGYTYDVVRGYTHSSLVIDQSEWQRPVGTDAQVLVKARKMIDELIADEAIIGQLERLIHNASGFQVSAPAEPVEVGDAAYVFAMGHYRRGIVTKVAKTRTTIAYTTASSGGRVFRKAVPSGEVKVGAGDR